MSLDTGGDSIMQALLQNMISSKVNPINLDDSEVSRLQSTLPGLAEQVSVPRNLSVGQGLLSALAGLAPILAGAAISGKQGAGIGATAGGGVVDSAASLFRKQNDSEKLPSLIEYLSTQNKLTGAEAYRARQAEKQDQRDFMAAMQGDRLDAQKDRQTERLTGIIPAEGSILSALAKTESPEGTPNRYQVQDTAEAPKLDELKAKYNLPMVETANHPDVQLAAEKDFQRLASKYGDPGKAYLAWHNGEGTVDKALEANPALDAITLAEKLPNTGPETKQAIQNFTDNLTGTPTKSIAREKMEKPKEAGISELTKVENTFSKLTKNQYNQGFAIAAAKNALAQGTNIGDAMTAEQAAQMGRSARFNEVMLKKLMPDTAQGKIQEVINYLEGGAKSTLQPDQRAAMQKVLEVLSGEVATAVKSARDATKMKYPGLKDDFYSGLGKDLEELVGHGGSTEVIQPPKANSMAVMPGETKEQYIARVAGNK